MADALFYVIGWGMVALAAITLWAVLTPNHLYVG